MLTVKIKNVIAMTVLEKLVDIYAINIAKMKPNHHMTNFGISTKCMNSTQTTVLFVQNQKITLPKSNQTKEKEKLTTDTEKLIRLVINQKLIRYAVIHFFLFFN